jgi:hypothetical protein
MKAGLKLIDNSSHEYQLGDVIRHLLRTPSYSQVAIATGYWDLPAMVEIFDELKAFLERDQTSFRLLLGEEPSVRAYQVRRPATQDPNFPEKYLKRDLEDLQLKEEFQKVADLLGKYVKSEGDSKLRIKVYKRNFLHAKCYIFGSLRRPSSCLGWRSSQ